MKKSFLGFFLLFILFTTYIPKFELDKNFNFLIKEIKLEGNFVVKDDKIIKRLDFLYKENLFFLNTKKIKKNLQKEPFIESYNIKKIYPDILKLSIVEKVPIAIIFEKKKKIYISNKGDRIDFTDIEIYKDLPTVIGEKQKFFALYKDLKNIKFPIEKIKSFYYFEAGRWDLIMFEGNTIKLPVEERVLSLKNFMKSTNDKGFNNYKIYDYRIKNQIILN